MGKFFFMKQALYLAKKGIGNTSPNPMVGAMVVRNGKIIAEAYHHYAGGPHAESLALEKAGIRAQGATLYVTLEPCVHFGKTPPCVAAIIQSGVKEVHIATLDPNPIVYGNGKRQLEKAGIRVNIGELEKEAKNLNEAFITYHTKKRPFIIAKWAMTLDGKIATHTGDSKWISSPKSRQFVHRLRSRVDAILVGVETVIHDNPALTVRLPHYKGKQPLRIILDRSNRTPPNSVVLKNLENTVIFHERNVSSLMKLLYERNILSVLVEGGGTVLASFFESKLVDKVYAFIAPIIVGGKESVTPVEGVGVDHIVNAHHIVQTTFQKYGSDILMHGYIKESYEAIFNH